MPSTRSRRPPRFAAPLAAAPLLAALLAAAALPAAAQPTFLVGVRAGYADLGSSDVFPDVYDSTLNPLGAQAEVRWRSVFLRLAYETDDADGSLVQPTLLPAPADPTTLSLDLVHLTFGWSSSSPGPWGWYAGGGVTLADSSESNVSGERSESGTGIHAVAGGRRAFAGHWEVGLEAMYVQVGGLFVAPPPAAAGDLVSTGAAATLAFRF